MPLETATYIHDLVVTNPISTDGINQGDDHLRLVKQVLQNTFPNATGPVSATPANINNGFVPIGGIVLWSGSVASIPTNWALCNGATVNGQVTPNLQDKFIVGAGNSYAVGATGGSQTPTGTGATDTFAAHSHTGGTGSHTLTLAEIPAHDHGLATSNVMAFNAGTLTLQTAAGPANTTLLIGSSVGGGGGHTHTISADGAHSHAVTSVTISDGRPPYYALCYIMRVA